MNRKIIKNGEMVTKKVELVGENGKIAGFVPFSGPF